MSVRIPFAFTDLLLEVRATELLTPFVVLHREQKCG